MQIVADANLRRPDAMQEPALHGEPFEFSTELRLSVLESTWRILAVMKWTGIEPFVPSQASNEIEGQ